MEEISFVHIIKHTYLNIFMHNEIRVWLQVCIKLLNVILSFNIKNIKKLTNDAYNNL